MELRAQLLGWLFLGMLVGWVFFIILGRTTVRRFDRNPLTRNLLGIELMSGWRIFNVAEALVMPVKLFDKFQSGRLAGFWADARVLRQHATRYDMVMAHLFFWTFVPSGVLMLAVVVLDRFGFFE